MATQRNPVAKQTNKKKTLKTLDRLEHTCSANTLEGEAEDFLKFKTRWATEASLGYITRLKKKMPSGTIEGRGSHKQHDVC